ncbi:MAG: leucine-rich repeat domain-containing protein [Gracilibacteraceae bacterium]|jgi:hypothetical protein|nr:leucine-rich repeat domain-containing protein [Gracilibacteraceae bacterium]
MDTEGAEEKMIVRDGVVFTDDMKTLVWYPGDKKGSAYEIPRSVTKIEGGAFDCVWQLQKITVARKNENYTVKDGVLFTADMKTLVWYPPQRKESAYTIPSGVTAIGAGAFSACGALASVTVPYSVTSIGNRAFVCCDKLTDIDMPGGLTSIGSEAFSCCLRLVNITIPHSVTSIGNGAFSCCFQLTDIVIPEGVTAIEDGTFDGCVKLMSITIPDGVTSIGERAFARCESLAGVAVPRSVTNIGSEAFSCCLRLANIVVHNVTKIKKSAFEGWTDVTVAGSVTVVGDYAFIECANLPSLTISGGPEHIAEHAFMNAGRLLEISTAEDGNNYVVLDGVLFSRDMKTLIFYPPAKEGSVYAIPTGVKRIKDRAFRGSKNLLHIAVPRSVTAVGGAFMGAERLREISVAEENTVYAAQDGVLFTRDMKTLVCYPPAKETAVYRIPESVASIGEGAFFWCENLAHIIADENSENYASRDGVLFTDDMKTLVYYPPAKEGSSYAIPTGVTRIKGSAFRDHRNLTGVAVPDSVTIIEGDMFAWFDLTIRAGENSCAAEYARDKGIKFEAVLGI